MSLCAACGFDIPEDISLCPHHDHGTSGGRDWARGNRIMCDFLHRRKAPGRLGETQRVDETIARSFDQDGCIIVQITRAPAA